MLAGASPEFFRKEGTMMTTLLQLAVSGAALGFVYALVGIEYSIIWNATGLLNFSHDKIITLGAYLIAGTFCRALGLPVAVSFLLALAAMIVVGILMSTFVFNPLRKMETIFTIMGTILLGKMILEIIRLNYGAIPFTLNGLMVGTIHIGNLAVAKANVYVIGIAVVVVAVLELFLKKTKTGKAMRCVSQNKKAAELMGINVKQNIRITGAISAVICMIIGFMIIPLYNVSLTMASMIGLKGFAAGVVGGFGYLPGCIVGGIVVGLIESMSALVIPSVYKDAVAFLVLIVFLMIKPSGILGKKA